MSKVFDYKGLKCPMPIFKLGKEVKELSSGDEVTVMSDDPAFPPDLKAFCKLRKMELVSLEESGGVITAQVKKL